MHASEIAALGKDRGPVFYEASLRYAQSLWRCGLPAQAMLQCNRALACSLSGDEEVLHRLPLPYEAMLWLMQNRQDDQFIGNPRRHFQHLATRMVEPFKELRTWRAWACWYLAKSVLPENEFPADWKQIRAEGVVEPVFSEIAMRLRALSPANDEEVWLKAAALVMPQASRVDCQLHIEPVGESELPLIRSLAYEIWPQVYPSIISMEQIHYMLASRYDLEVLREDVRERGVRFALVKEAARPVGFVAFEPNARTGEAFLHKLYLLPEMAGKGAGAQGLAWVSQQARSGGMGRVRLFVNKHNHAAVRAYLRQGFTFECDKITDIGNGFVMDDYVMVKVL